MSRPREYEQRVTTSVRFPPETLSALHKAAEERDLSVNYLVNRAVEDFLSRLVPVEEFTAVRGERA